jgi:hypothetical protein
VKKTPLACAEHRVFGDTLYQIYSRAIYLHGLLDKRLGKTHRVRKRLEQAVYKLFKARDNLDLLCHDSYPGEWDRNVYRIDLIGCDASTAATIPEIARLLQDWSHEVSTILARLWQALPVQSAPVKALEKARDLLNYAAVPLVTWNQADD